MKKKFLGLFEGFGIESEYMCVDEHSFKIVHASERILSELNGGKLTDEVEDGDCVWSNELVDHVIELKGNGPLKSLDDTDQVFHQSIIKVQELMSSWGMKLLPTAMHFTMNPDQEMRLWPHGQKEIYSAYDRIFNCKGHGWSNLQSVHLNLPFKDDEEFGRLHAAVRLVLPLYPLLASSSPIVDGNFSQYPSNRLEVYRNNQKKVPLVTGKVIPERVFTLADYESLLDTVYASINPLDPGKILQHQWLNSRGAIVKFDVQAIEIRVMDIQESPLMDFSILSFIVSLIKDLVAEKNISYKEQQLANEDELFELMQSLNSWNQQSLLIPDWYARYFAAAGNLSSSEFLNTIYQPVKVKMPIRYQQGIEYILSHGNLASRIRSKFEKLTSKKLNKSDAFHSIFNELSEALINNVHF